MLAELGGSAAPDEGPEDERVEDPPHSVPWNRPWVPVLRENMGRDVRQRLLVGPEVPVVSFSEEEFFYSVDLGELVRWGRPQLIVLVPNMPEAQVWDDVQRVCVRRYFYSRQVRLFELALQRD